MITTTQFAAMSNDNVRRQEIEQRIDKAIQAAAAFGQRKTTIALGSYPRHIVELILADYRMCGWDAQIVNDSRDGDFIQLEPRP